MSLTSGEQYLLELVNRARLDPAAEAARLGISLTAGGAQLAGGPRQAVAPNVLLERAADGHAQWMLATDTFSHAGQGESSKNDRAAVEGYYGSLGENLSLLDVRYGTGETLMNAHHRQLWDSPNHRTTMLNENRREVGISIETGGYRSGEVTIASQLFGIDQAYFVTGVAYNDRNGNAAYNMGEGVSGLRFASGRSVDQSEGAGGYAIAVGAGAAIRVDLAVGRQAAALEVDTRAGNVKIDVVNGERLDIAGSFNLLSGDLAARMLGAGGYSASGSDAGDVINGNKGANRIGGDGGWDALGGGDGNDNLSGGYGNDRIWGGGGNDRVRGDHGDDKLNGDAGNDWLGGGYGNDRLTGGAGADQFAFGPGLGRDTVTDFSRSAGDTIVLDDALWRGAKTAQQVVADHARVTPAGFVVLDFGAAGIIELRGVTSTAGLAGQIEII
jgi:hypothetical protein